MFALGFMTKLPVTTNPDIELEDFSVILNYFPIVGFLLGLLLSIVAWICTQLFDPFLSAILVVLSLVVLTGGLHIDGLGDTFDALFSYRSKERMLEIMKDSRIGTNGILAILFVLLLKIALIHHYLQYTQEGFLVLLTMPIIGRFALTVSCYKNVYAREGGMGSPFIGKVSDSMFLRVIFQTLSAVLVFPFFLTDPMLISANIFAFLVCYGFVRLSNRFVSSKIGGLTGDTLGAVCELTELMYLFLFYLGGSLMWTFI